MLDSSVAFLNHGSYGACPTAALAYQAELRRQLEANPVRFFQRLAPALLDEVRHQVAEFVDADAAGIAFVSNASAGVQTILSSLATKLGPNDEILTTDHTYNACRSMLLRVAEQSGARIVTVPLRVPLKKASEIFEPIMAAVTPRTRLALLDHITSPSALVFPISELVAALQARGVDVLVDGAHAPGQVAVSLRSLGAAYYVSNAHKWMCAPKGAAFLYVRHDRREGIHPLVVSHGYFPGGDRYRREFDWTGTDDPTAVLTISESLRVLASLMGGHAALQRRNHQLASWAAKKVSDELSLERVASDELMGAMAAWRLPPSDVPRRHLLEPDALQQALAVHHSIEAPVMVLAKQRLLRIAIHAHTSEADVKRLITALKHELSS